MSFVASVPQILLTFGYSVAGMWWYHTKYVRPRKEGRPTGQEEKPKQEANASGVKNVERNMDRALSAASAAEQAERGGMVAPTPTAGDVAEGVTSVAAGMLSSAMSKHQQEIVANVGRHKVLLFFIFFFVGGEVNADIQTALSIQARQATPAGILLTMFASIAAIIAGVRFIVLVWAQYSTLCLAAQGQGKGCCTACCCATCFFCPCPCGYDDWTGADKVRIGRVMSRFFWLENLGNKALGRMEQALDFLMVLISLASLELGALGWAFPALTLSLCGHVVVHDGLLWYECTDAAHVPKDEELADVPDQAAWRTNPVLEMKQQTARPNEAVAFAVPTSPTAPPSTGESGDGSAQGMLSPDNVRGLASGYALAAHLHEEHERRSLGAAGPDDLEDEEALYEILDITVQATGPLGMFVSDAAFGGGATITYLKPEGLGTKSDLQLGDTIEHVGGVQVADMEQCERLLASTPRPLALQVRRASTQEQRLSMMAAAVHVNIQGSPVTAAGPVTSSTTAPTSQSAPSPTSSTPASPNRPPQSRRRSVEV